MEMKIVKKLNLSALICWTTTMFVLTAAYVMEIVKGLREIPYVAIMTVIALVPVIVAFILFKMKTDTKAVRFIMLFSYSLYFGIVLFESPYALTVAYIFPILAALTLYGDAKLTILSVVINMVIVVARIVYNIILGNTEASQITEYEIQFFAMLLCGAFLIVAVRCIAYVNQYRMGQVQEGQRRSEGVTSSIVEAGEAIAESVADIQSSVMVQQENAGRTSTSLVEVAEGIENVAMNLKEQSNITENIQESVRTVADSATQMAEQSSNTRKLVVKNSANLEEAKVQSEMIKEESSDIMTKIKMLEDKTQEMESILVLISDVSDNTNLLSLNASIEAARAGEVGKGFAVVADQIRTLAESTKTSAMEIEYLLSAFHDLSADVQNSVVGAIEKMELQKNSIDETYQGFNDMEQSLIQLDDSANQIHTEMEQLKESNQTIVEAIAEMSAVSEQISEHTKAVEELSEETKEAGVETSQQIDMIAKRMEDLVSMK